GNTLSGLRLSSRRLNCATSYFPFWSALWLVPSLSHLLNVRCSTAQDTAPRARQVDGGWLAGAIHGHKNISPSSAAGRNFADIQHHVGEVLEEHTGPHFAFRAFGDDAERNLPEALIGVADGDEQNVGGCRPGQDGQHSNRPHQSPHADAAGLQRD